MNATVAGQELDAAVERLDVSAYTIPTDEPESDGTLEWDSTTIVVVEAHAAGRTGVGYTYADASVAELIRSKVAPVVCNSLLQGWWRRVGAALRNVGRPGAGWMALSAVDVALWDLRARLLDVPLVALLPAEHSALPVYGSGGFTSYSLDRLRGQLGGWVADGIPRVKLKIGREPTADPARLDAVREEIGPDVELYGDANGAYTRKQAVHWAARLVDEWEVTWLEEPVSSADFAGLRLVRDRAALEVAAGEYGYVPADFRNLLESVDCLQADVTRCGGITGILRVGALAEAHNLELSSHGAPALSAHAFAAIGPLRHLEWFHDHLRVERLLFDGLPEVPDGCVRPDRSRPGHGLELKHADAERYAA